MKLSARNQIKGKITSAEPASGDVVVNGGSDRMATMTVADLERMPAVHVMATFGNGPGKPAAFEGPLLWTVLTEAHALTLASRVTCVEDRKASTGRQRLG